MDMGEIKRKVAHTVVDRFVRSGMKVGLGTGSTAIHAVRRIGERIASGDLTGVLAVSTSFESSIEAARLGIPLRTMNDLEIDGTLDVAIDGADEIDVHTGYLIKGGGGAHTQEKLVEYAAATMYVVVDESKLSERLGSSFPIPVEVVPAALRPVTRALERLGGRVELRMAQRKAGPVITDNGNLIVDLSMRETSFDPAALEGHINAIPGVLENGLFTRAATSIWVGRSNGTVEELVIG